MDVYRTTKWVQRVGLFAESRKDLEKHNTPYVLIRHNLEYAIFRKIWPASSLEVKDETENLASILERVNYSVIYSFNVSDEDLGIKNKKVRSKKQK